MYFRIRISGAPATITRDYFPARYQLLDCDGGAKSEYYTKAVTTGWDGINGTYLIPMVSGFDSDCVGPPRFEDGRSVVYEVEQVRRIYLSGVLKCTITGVIKIHVSVGFVVVEPSFHGGTLNAATNIAAPTCDPGGEWRDLSATKDHTPSVPSNAPAAQFTVDLDYVVL